MTFIVMNFLWFVFHIRFILWAETSPDVLLSSPRDRLSCLESGIRFNLFCYQFYGFSSCFLSLVLKSFGTSLVLFKFFLVQS